MALEHIGQKLKTARDGLGLSLSQIHERTKIPFNHLQAIDNGQADDLPEPVYVSGFIKRYAECVGLNGQQLAEEYREEVDGAPHSNGGFGFLPRGMKEREPVATPPVNYFNRTRIEQPPPNLFKIVLFPALWVVLALGGLIFLASRQQNLEVAQDPSVLSLKDSTAKFTGLPTPPEKTTQPALAPENKQVNPTGEPGTANQLSTTSASTDTTETPATPPPTNDARIVLTGNRHVWVEVKSEGIGGEVKYMGSLETGDRRDFQDPVGLRVVAGSGGNLSVEVNGKAQVFGAPGKRTERVFMAKNAQITVENPENKAASKTANALSTPSTAKKPPATKKTVNRSLTKRLEGVPSRQYIPGESLGSGTRATDVPYRY